MTTNIDPNDNSSKALVQINDLLGLQKPALELVRAIVRGIGAYCEPWLQKRKAKVDIEIFSLWKPHLTSADELPSFIKLDLGDRAAIRFRSEEVRRQTNRELIALEAAKDAIEHGSSESTSAGYEAIEDDWIDRFWRIAQDISDERMQSLWGRVLSRQTTGVSRYSIRTLEILSTLSRKEASKLEWLARFALSHKSAFKRRMRCGIITGISRYGDKARDFDREITDAIGDYEEETFGPMGVFIESGWAYEFCVLLDGDCATLRCGDTDIFLPKIPGNIIRSGPLGGYVNIACGIEFSPMGIEILSLIRATASPDLLALLKRGFASQSLGCEYSRWR